MEQIFMQYGLSPFYDAETDTCIFMDDYNDIEAVFPQIARFLLNNESWSLCHTLWGTDDGYWYLAKTNTIPPLYMV